MKFVILFLLVSAMQVTAGVYSQEAKVTLQVENASFESVIRLLEKSTDYTFLYEDRHVESVQHLNLHYEDVDIKVVLDACLKGTNLAYKLMNHTIIIQPCVQRDTLEQSQSKQKDNKIRVTGVVKDEEGELMPGVTVVIKGTTVGTSTDVKGEYQIMVPSDGVLLFSFIGMTTAEESLKGRKEVDVVMKVASYKVKEVVVMGLFNRPGDSFTGAVKSFKGEDLLKVNPTNVLQALSILDPAVVQIENLAQGSNPNFIPKLEIRGSTSIAGMESVGSLDAQAKYTGDPNMPLFILDGFEVSSEKIFDLDPQRVAQISIHKDASATAIYGSRAANGVVIITTKLPKGGTINVTYNLDLGGNFPDLRSYNLLNAREKVEMEIIGGAYGIDKRPAFLEKESDELNEKYKMVAKGYNTYWLNKPLRNAISQKHSMTLDGGEGNLRFSIDGSWNREVGVMKGSDRTVKSLGIMLQYNIKDRVTLRNMMSYEDMVSNDSPYRSFDKYVRLNPYYPLYDEAGNYTSTLGVDNNPLKDAQLHQIHRSRYNYWTNNFSSDFWLTKDFNLRAEASIFWQDSRNDNFLPGAHSQYLEKEQNAKGEYSLTNGRTYGFDARVSGQYNLQLDKHLLFANGIFSFRSDNTDEASSYMQGFSEEKLDFIGFGQQYSTDFGKVEATEENSRLMSIVGSINYSYDNRFLTDINVNADASSKFGEDSRWAPFWSVGIGWNMHNEKFLQKLGFVDVLKLRASYGYTGSQNFYSYQAVVTYEYQPDPYAQGVGTQLMAMGNPDLKWQKVLKRNVGANLSFFDGIADISFDYYNELSKSLLTDILLPPSLGFDSYKANIGEIKNEGWELGVRISPIKKQNAWLNIIINASRNRNIIKKLSSSVSAWNEEEDSYLSTKIKVRYEEGQSTKTIWGLKSLGINPASGAEIFRMPDGGITDQWKAEYQVPIGVDEPDLQGSIGINVGWKNFQLTTYFSYRIGGQHYNQTLVDKVEGAYLLWNVDKRKYDKTWAEVGDVTFFKAASLQNATFATSRFVFDYSYLRCSSFNISYDFEKRWLAHVGLKAARLSFSTNDLFFLSTVKEERGTSYPYAKAGRVSLRIMF